jgi:hypothetical protein
MKYPQKNRVQGVLRKPPCPDRCDNYETGTQVSAQSINLKRRTFMKKLLSFIALLTALVFSGCAHMHNPEQPNASLAYGYIDMDDAPTNVDIVTIRQYKPKPANNKPYRTVDAVKGMFWFDQLAPGSYQLVEFGGSSCWKNMAANYSMQDFSRNETALVIAKPGLYYMGSYKYRKVGGFFSNKFTIERAATPSEKQLLQKMLEYSTGTQWEAMIKKRIGVLK